MRLKYTLLPFALALTACSSPSPPTPTPTTPLPSSYACDASTNGYCYGYGTYYVAQKRKVPRNWGNANSWYASAQRDGYKVGTTPKKGAIACTSAGGYGQVAIVEEVLEDGATIRISEMHGKGGWNVVTMRETPATAFTYIYLF